MYGVSGGRARCSPFWEDLMACAQESGRREQWEKCKHEREDYIECLHHKKLVCCFHLFLRLKLFFGYCVKWNKGSAIALQLFEKLMF